MNIGIAWLAAFFVALTNANPAKPPPGPRGEPGETPGQAPFGRSRGAAVRPAKARQAPAPESSTAPGRAGRRTPVISDLSGFELADPSLLAATVDAATRGQPPVVPMAPRLGLAYSLLPVFSWADPRGTGRFAFSFRDDDGTELFRTEVAGTRLAYPAQAPALEPGRTYWWSVRTVEARPRRTWDAGIRILDGARREALAAAGEPPLEALVEARAWYDLLAHLDSRIAEAPADPDALAGRARLLGQFSWTRPYAGRQGDRGRTQR